MAAQRTPGTQGLFKNIRLDSGTSALTHHAPPGIQLSYTWDPNKKEGITTSIALRRSDAYSISDGRVVGKVYFANDVDKVELDDMLGLAPLINSLTERVNEDFEISLLCVGSADYRASDDYNLDLGYRRANNVARFIKRYVLGSATASDPLFTIKAPRSLGESKAAQPTNAGERPSEKTMGKDRVVMIKIDTNGLVPPVTLAFEGPPMYSKMLEVIEVRAGGKIGYKVVTRKDEQKSLYVERNDQRNHAKGKQNMKDDPLYALVDIRVKVIQKIVNGQKNRVLLCDAVYLPTGRVLFSLPKPALIKLGGEYDYKSVYKQLKGSYLNITARINVLLKRKLAKKLNLSPK